MLVSFAGNALTSIMASITAFPLYFKQYTNIMEAVQLQLEIYINVYIVLLQLIKVCCFCKNKK
jgi:hypothetical protein